MRTKRVQIGVLIVLLALLAGIGWQRQAIADWLKLRGYTPPPAVATLASDDTMTPAARHLFYVNHPDITKGSAFTANCPAGSEKTVVLGCYIGGDQGIYIYAVSDSRLDGVEQVTAAHEMLHAAYNRLGGNERRHVDNMLLDYYEHGLTDQRVKDTIAAYKKSEPNNVANEMHSVFGTEVADLPSGLETYYRQYFTDRAQVATYTARYQGEFTSRQQQVAAYDAQLKSLKTQIDNSEASLRQQRASLDGQSQQLQTYRNNGQIAAYNAAVPAYNQAIDRYNASLTATKKLINQYNDIVSARNAIALEEQQLASELSANSLPGGK